MIKTTYGLIYTIKKRKKPKLHIAKRSKTANLQDKSNVKQLIYTLKTTYDNNLHDKIKVRHLTYTILNNVRQLIYIIGDN